MSTRIHPDVVVRNISEGLSSRGGVRPKIIVVHSTEGHNRPGNSDLIGLASYLHSAAREASCHVCTDADGHSARIVDDEDKAWHCAGYNSVALGIEQIGVAATEHWNRDEYRETARWIARWSRKYGIPIRQGRTAGGHVLRSGVVTHKSLGAIGGGHVDPGPNYNLGDVLNLAKFYRSKL